MKDLGPIWPCLLSGFTLKAQNLKRPYYVLKSLPALLSNDVIVPGWARKTSLNRQIIQTEWITGQHSWELSCLQKVFTILPFYLFCFRGKQVTFLLNICSFALRMTKMLKMSCLCHCIPSSGTTAPHWVQERKQTLPQWLFT